MKPDTDTPDFVTPAWSDVVLVCKDCRKRSSGPEQLKTKAVVSELKRSMRDEKPRPRIVATGCLGICPKRAMAVALLQRNEPPRIALVGSASQVAQVWRTSAGERTG